jgi:hypothetical protein
VQFALNSPVIPDAPAQRCPNNVHHREWVKTKKYSQNTYLDDLSSHLGFKSYAKNIIYPFQ